MDLPTPAPAEPEQLPLPLDLSQPVLPTDASTAVLTPPQVWSSLPPLIRAQCRQTLVQILQEVLHDRSS